MGPGTRVSRHAERLCVGVLSRHAKSRQTRDIDHDAHTGLNHRARILDTILVVRQTSPPRGFSLRVGGSDTDNALTID